jgi:peptide-methionine (R)-S-oxide reductase
VESRSSASTRQSSTTSAARERSASGQGSGHYAPRPARPQGENWRRWGQKYWPTVYVLDRAGRVRFKWEGELEYQGAGGTKKASAVIENLLREPKPTARAEAPATFQLVSDEKPAQKKGVGRVVKSEAQWKKILTPMQFDVLRKKGTEAPFSGDSKPKKKPGTFACAGCGLSLFSSRKMFDSGTGWPSFWQPIAGHVREHTDEDGERVEVLCARCDGHLGHVFNDGPKPTGLRYCMNAVAMKFAPAKK